MGRGKKRRNYYSDFKDAKRWKGVLSVGMKGFLCTCNMRVKECIREAYNLLNDYAEKTIVVEEEEIAEESIEDELERELKDMRKKPSEKMFQVVETGADNTVFIRTTIDDPVKLASEIFSDIFATKQNKSRFLLRMVPIEVTCKAYMDDIRKAADQMFDAHFKCNPLAFNVFYKARYNSSLLRDEVLTAMVTLVRDRNPAHTVDLTSPLKTVVVEVIKGVCCLSVVTDFYKHRKYNLLEAAKGETPEGGKSGAGAVETVAVAEGSASEPEQKGANVTPVIKESATDSQNGSNATPVTGAGAVQKVGMTDGSASEREQNGANVTPVIEEGATESQNGSNATPVTSDTATDVNQDRANVVHTPTESYTAETNCEVTKSSAISEPVV